ncbi:hypothetical protein GWK47_053745 [Chionoecetes opilio]|uniref:Uncharacterized protein n=1 Tax=Chionoecetes opilio TaxID=41210 RepID=A0A8J5CR31_CHIOP|nr:hypothetical protein GWK47_053745 [Chionoecetes opilio]
MCVCLWKPSEHPTRTTSPGSPTSRTVEGDRRSPRGKMVRGALGRTVFAMGTHAATRDERSAHHVHIGQTHAPPRSHVPASVPLHFLTRYDGQLDERCYKGISRSGARRRAHRMVLQNG